MLLPITGEGSSSTLSFVLVVPVKKQEVLTTSGLYVHLYFQTTAQTRSSNGAGECGQETELDINSITDTDQTKQSHPDNKDTKTTWGKDTQSTLLHFFFFRTSPALGRRLQEDIGKIRGMGNKLTSAVSHLAQMGGCKIKPTQETAAKRAEAFLGDLQRIQLIPRTAGAQSALQFCLKDPSPCRCDFFVHDQKHLLEFQRDFSPVKSNTF